MKYLVLFASLFVMNGCDPFNFSCGMFGSSGWLRPTAYTDRTPQDMTLTTGEIRTIFLDPVMHVDYVYEGAEDCREPDYKAVPDYSVRLEDGSLADVSIMTDTTKVGRYEGHAKNLRIDAKSIGSTRLILTAKWFVYYDSDAGTFNYQTRDFEIELLVTP